MGIEMLEWRDMVIWCKLMAPATSFKVDIAHLDAGLYFFRVKTMGGAICTENLQWCVDEKRLEGRKAPFQGYKIHVCGELASLGLRKLTLSLPKIYLGGQGRFIRKDKSPLSALWCSRL